MAFKEYGNYDGLGLADLVRKKQVSPGELLDEAVARTAKVDPQINAVVVKHYDYAERQIEKGLPDGPFTGVPFLLKDLDLLEGTRTTFGASIYKDDIANHTGTLAQRFLNAGLTIFGKSASPEFGLMPTTEPRLFGPTRNPWNLAHSSGGSSGGAGAAVAARILPVAHASDGGGSIRIPASASGVFGLKPTRARNPSGPDRGEGWGGLFLRTCAEHQRARQRSHARRALRAGAVEPLSCAAAGTAVRRGSQTRSRTLAHRLYRQVALWRSDRSRSRGSRSRCCFAAFKTRPSCRGGRAAACRRPRCGDVDDRGRPYGADYA